jgi:predicted enzyme related to lactoylglutathione lyase
MHVEIEALLRDDVVMFEYDVHNMQRALRWYQDVFGFEIIYGPGPYHTEFALPVKGATMALSWVDESVKIQKGPRLFLPTHDLRAVERYMKSKGVKTKPIEKVDEAVLILWVEDCEGNYLAIEQWLDR